MRTIVTIVGICGCLMIGHRAWSQNSSHLFVQAQAAVEQKQYALARRHCQTLLREQPQHYDARLLVIYTYAWDHQFGEAEQSLVALRTDLASVEPSPLAVVHQATLCGIQLAYWQGEHAQAVERADEGLAQFPDDTEFAMLKGRAALAHRDYETALAAFDQVLTQDPDHAEAQRLRDEAYWHVARYQAGLSYSHERYSNSKFPRNTVRAELSRLWPTLTLTGRASRSYRFDVVSQQIELDAWKVLSQRWYLYGQVGHSDGRLFPRYRAALEPFYKVAPTVDVSAGVRYLRYTTQDAWIYTASASKYFKRGSITGRTYWSPASPGWRKSFELGGRWFTPDAYSFVELKVGSGASPDNDYLDANFQEVRRSHSLYTVLGVQRRFRHRLLGKVWTVFDRQMPEPSDHFSIMSFNVGLWKRF